MMTVTHAIIGATSGKLINSLVIVFFLNLILHFPLDRIPHYLPKKKGYLIAVMTADGVLTIGFLLMVYFFGGGYRLNMLVGALAGISVDVLLVLTPLLKTEIGSWHVERQNHQSKVIFYAMDLAGALLLAIVWWVIK